MCGFICSFIRSFYLVFVLPNVSLPSLFAFILLFHFHIHASQDEEECWDTRSNIPTSHVTCHLVYLARLGLSLPQSFHYNV